MIRRRSREKIEASPKGWLEVVVGIDPGLACVGVAAVTFPKGEPIWFEALVEPKDVKAKDMNHRALQVADRVRDTIRKHGGMEHVSIFMEDAAYNAQYQSEALASVRQAIYQLMIADLVVRPVSIQKGKAALVGSGRATKDQMVAMAKSVASESVYLRYFGNATKERREAMADALGIALAGVSWWKEKGLLAT